MFKSLLCSLFVFLSICPSDYSYHLKMTFKRDVSNPSVPNYKTVLNDEEAFCCCGRPPVCTMFFYGRPEHYCSMHLPEFEKVRPLKSKKLDDVINSLNLNNVNGANDVKK